MKLTIYDADGEPVRNLGLVNPWMCQASLTHREKLPQNEYVTSSLFHALRGFRKNCSSKTLCFLIYLSLTHPHFLSPLPPSPPPPLPPLLQSLAQLEGVTSVPFIDGVAEFTRLRVDRKADQLTLSFTTVPFRFQTETSIGFRVVGFPDSVEKKQVSFLLSGSGSNLPSSVEWNGDEIIGEVVREVGVALDVDPSRIQNVTIQELEWVRVNMSHITYTKH